MRSRSTIARGARQRGDDRRVVAGQAIEQTGLARIRRARQYHRHAIAQQTSVAGVARDRREMLADIAQSIGKRLVRQKVYFLFRKIDRGFHVGAQLNHPRR